MARMTLRQRVIEQINEHPGITPEQIAHNLHRRLDVITLHIDVLKSRPNSPIRAKYGLTPVFLYPAEKAVENGDPELRKALEEELEAALEAEI